MAWCKGKRARQKACFNFGGTDLNYGVMVGKAGFVSRMVRSVHTLIVVFGFTILGGASGEFERYLPYIKRVGARQVKTLDMAQRSKNQSVWSLGASSKTTNKIIGRHYWQN